jgi:hypothetical protein
MSEKTQIIKPTVRDERGLLNNVNYIFNKDGTVNWRAMVNPAHLYPNKDWFARRNQTVPETADGLRDEQLLIKLGGIKEVAKLRGYSSVSFEFPKLERDYVVALCSVCWIPNFETNVNLMEDKWPDTPSSMDVANATFENTDGFGQKFLETIAANRAFVRAVRNHLGIHIVGEDEIAKGNGAKAAASAVEGSADVSPQSILSKKFSENIGGEFNDFKSWLRQLWKDESYQNADAANWKAWIDIPTKEARALLKFVK